jgi:hypothetical protein
VDYLNSTNKSEAIFRDTQQTSRPRRSAAEATRTTIDRIVLPLPGIGTLELPADIYEQHLVRATAAVPAARETESELVDAEQLEERTRIPASWWMSQARERRIPFRKFGKYVRFNLEEVLACDAYQRRAVP